MPFSRKSSKSSWDDLQKSLSTFLCLIPSSIKCEKWYLHLFSRTTVASYHKLGGWKQCKCMTLQFCRLESNRSLRELKSRCCWQGCVPSRGPRGESLSCPFPASRGHPYSLVHVLIPPSPASKPATDGQVLLTSNHSDHLFCLLLPLLRTLVITLDSPG